MDACRGRASPRGTARRNLAHSDRQDVRRAPLFAADPPRAITASRRERQSGIGLRRAAELDQHNGQDLLVLVQRLASTLLEVLARSTQSPDAARAAPLPQGLGGRRRVRRPERLPLSRKAASAPRPRPRRPDEPRPSRRAHALARQARDGARPPIAFAAVTTAA